MSDCAEQPDTATRRGCPDAEQLRRRNRNDSPNPDPEAAVPPGRDRPGSATASGRRRARTCPGDGCGRQTGRGIGRVADHRRRYNRPARLGNPQSARLASRRRYRLRPRHHRSHGSGDDPGASACRRRHGMRVDRAVGRSGLDTRFRTARSAPTPYRSVRRESRRFGRGLPPGRGHPAHRVRRRQGLRAGSVDDGRKGSARSGDPGDGIRTDRGQGTRRDGRRDQPQDRPAG